METRIYSHFLYLIWVFHMSNGHFRKKIVDWGLSWGFCFLCFSGHQYTSKLWGFKCIHLNAYIKKTKPKVFFFNSKCEYYDFNHKMWLKKICATMLTLKF